MKTTFIFLACLLVLAYGYNWANIKKKCDNKAVGIASQDCKEQCNVAELGEDCAKCVGTHKDYDYDCKEIYLWGECCDIYYQLTEEDCKEQCVGSQLNTCKPCIMNHQDVGLTCLVLHHIEPNPPPGVSLSANPLTLEWCLNHYG